MRAFLQPLDEKVWLVVEVGWTKPTTKCYKPMGKTHPWKLACKCRRRGMKMRSKLQISIVEHWMSCLVPWLTMNLRRSHP